MPEKRSTPLHPTQEREHRAEFVPQGHTSLDSFIESKLTPRIGDGKRFADRGMYEALLTRIAREHGDIKPVAAPEEGEALNPAATTGARSARAAPVAYPPFKGLQFPEGKTNLELIAYAREQKWHFGDLLEQLNKVSGGGPRDMAAVFGATNPDQYTRCLKQARAPVTTDILHRMAAKLGATTREDFRQWRQYMLDIPPEKNQDALNAYMDAIDLKSDKIWNLAASEFLVELAECKGFPKRSQLAKDIAIFHSAGKSSGPLEIEIDRAFGQVASIKDTEAGVFSPSTKLPEGMDKKDAVMIATYAFPDDKTRQEKCKTFLQGTKKEYFKKTSHAVQVASRRAQDEREPGVG